MLQRKVPFLIQKFIFHILDLYTGQRPFGIFPKVHPILQRHLSLTDTYVWLINPKFHTLCDFDNFVRIVNNQPTPSNWGKEPVVIKRSRSHRLTISIFFCLFCISHHLLDIILFNLRDGFTRKNCCSFRFCSNEGGGAAQNFWHLFMSAFLVNRKRLFPRKCQ